MREAAYRPELGQLDRDGNEIEDRIYNTKDLDRNIVLDEPSGMAGSCKSAATGRGERRADDVGADWYDARPDCSFVIDRLHVQHDRRVYGCGQAGSHP